LTDDDNKIDDDEDDGAIPALPKTALL